MEDEFSRILYVACSRAINKLFVYIECSELESQKIINSLELWKKTKGITANFYAINSI